MSLLYVRRSIHCFMDNFLTNHNFPCSIVSMEGFRAAMGFVSGRLKSEKSGLNDHKSTVRRRASPLQSCHSTFLFSTAQRLNQLTPADES